MSVATPTRPIPFSSRPGELTWEVARLFPLQGQWTEGDYLALHTNQLIELSDGCLEVLPMPTILHQLIVEYLYSVLKAFVTAHTDGRVLFAPLPVQLWSGKFREPDITYLRPHRLSNLRGQPTGADLVMEVVSEGQENRDRDLVTKRQEYAQAGIAEYWIIDPQEHQISVLVLDGSVYRVHGVFDTGTVASSVLLPGLSVNVDAALNPV
jgi:Uma2 family endonuclease